MAAGCLAAAFGSVLGSALALSWAKRHTGKRRRRDANNKRKECSMERLLEREGMALASWNIGKAESSYQPHAPAREFRVVYSFG